MKKKQQQKGIEWKIDVKGKDANIESGLNWYGKHVSGSREGVVMKNKIRITLRQRDALRWRNVESERELERERGRERVRRRSGNT